MVSPSLDTFAVFYPLPAIQFEILILSLQFFNGHDTPIAYPEKETADDNDTSSDITNSLEIHSEPAIPSNYAFNDESESVMDKEICMSDPGLTVGNLSEELVVDKLDGSSSKEREQQNNTRETSDPDLIHHIDSSDMPHENSAFTKVAPSKQQSTSSGMGETSNVEDQQVEGAVGFDIPELTYLDRNNSEKLITSIENNNENFELPSKTEIPNNTDTVNDALHRDTFLRTPHVTGNIPPHNSPVCGSNKEEINLQDVQIALTQVFNNGFGDEQHLENGHDFRRSVSADVYTHEKEKDPEIRLRHHSGIVQDCIQAMINGELLRQSFQY